MHKLTARNFMGINESNDSALGYTKSLKSNDFVSTKSTININ